MNKLATALLAATCLLAPVALAQSIQDLPAAPTPVQPRFPGAPAQAPQKPAAGQTGTPAASPAQTPAAPSTETPQATPPKTETEAPSAAPQSTQNEAAPKDNPQDTLPPVAGEPQKPAGGQQQAVESGGFLIGVDVDLVNLIFTAVDKHGHFVKDLKRSDIRLMDEGKPPARVEAFESETGLPLRVGLLIDASNSIRDRFRFEQEAAVEFLHQVVRPKSDRAFVLGFDSLMDLTQDYTDNADQLARGVRVLRPGGGTALHDAVFQACEKLSKAPVKGPSRRAIILLSDGDDNQSRHTREEAVEAALRAEVIIYVISTNITESDKKGDKVLMRYADATGGRVFFPLRMEEVSNAFNEIQDELRSQYVIAYKPQNFVEDGRYRPITIDAPGRGNVKVRTRKGYFAPNKK